MKDLSSFDLAFRSGLQGGAVGGAVAALPVVVIAYLREGVSLSEFAEIVLYTILVGAVIGISALSGMAMASRLLGGKPWSTWLANVIGSVVACALTGTLMGLVGARWFGSWDHDTAPAGLVLGAALLGSTVILYDTGGRIRRMILYCLLPLPVSGVVALAASLMFELDDKRLGFTSARLGFVAGVVMGLQIGLGLSSYRQRTWARHESPERPAA